MEKNMRRKVWLDYVRVTAIIFVVLCHATESCYGPVIKGKIAVDSFTWAAENTLFTLGRLGVPLFLAITGALLLGREYHPMDFYKRSLLPLLWTTEIWIILNYFFACAFQKESFEIGNLMCEVLFLRTPELSHMWYMPMILGIYVAIPFLARIPMIFIKKKDYLIPVIFAISAWMVIPTINVFLKEAILGKYSLNMQLDLGYLGGVYGIYLFAGYFIGKKDFLKTVKTKWLLLCWMIAFLCNTAGQYFLYEHKFFASNRLLWYTSIFVFLMGMILFELIRRKELRSSIWIDLISKCSFGIFLLHKPVQVLTMKMLPMQEWNVFLQIGILLMTGLGISILILIPFYIKWKKLGKLLFFMK